MGKPVSTGGFWWESCKSVRSQSSIVEGKERGSGGKGAVAQGSVLGCGDGGQEVGVNRLETAGGGMALEKVGQIKLGKLFWAL